MLAPVTHRRITAAGIDTFVRESGPPDAPVLLLPHGYPASSFEFRGLMPALGDRWRLVAPDAPGFGYSATPPPADFAYTFAAYAEWLEGVVDVLALDRYAIWLHDYGSQWGLELALAHPERVTALVIQNGDVHPDEFGPKYAALAAYWRDPTPLGFRDLEANVSEAGFRDEFVGEVPDAIAARVPPDLWVLHAALLTPERREIARLFHDQSSTLDRMPLQRGYLAEHRPPTLVIWGPHDGYMPAPAARAYRRELPDAEIHVLPDAGHWLLETHLGEAVDLVRDFLGRTLG